MSGSPACPGNALVTGATRGIGKAIAQRLADSGYHLTLSARNDDALRAVARELGGTGVEVRVAAADMAVESDVRALARGHVDRFGTVGLLLLCAGVGTAGLLADYPLHRFDRQVAVNLRGSLALLQECLPGLRAAASKHPDRGARVVAISSMAGVASEPGLAAYAATKAALISLCQSVNVEESHGGVSATAISPGYVDTDMSAWKHDEVAPNEMIQAADVAELVAGLTRLSSRAVVPHVMVARRGSTQWRA
ncbi:MAG: SDR family NAD(P)-dependent oxidoreductase [Micromonosporaceae bacterium]|nr:SDR family NAD(P)-dependent oxidoreductase [Micromonosporaceae bacterium]